MYDIHQPWAVPPAGQISAIAVTARYSWLAFVLALFRPSLTVNGQPVPAAWGRTVVPVPPGQHHVQVYVPYLLPPRVGPAETVVPVHPGQVVEVEYRAPVIAWIGGAIGPAPQPVRGLAAGIALLVVPLVALLCIGGGVAALVLSQDDGTPAARQPADTQPPPPTAGTPRTSSPTPDPTPESGTGEPTLRQVPARTVAGPSYAPGDKTYTMTLDGLPFAFRTPTGWGCLGATVDVPDAKAWVCIDEGNPFEAGGAPADRTKRAQIMLRPCPASCGPAERATRDQEWFEGAKATAVDERTSFIETAKDDKGRYSLDLSHFFTGGDGDRWQVGVWAYSDPEDRAVPQKIVNDLLTQAG
ncbi:hypothetical protein ACIA8K_32835 [Catenuloplanes sp. NPDC051500]|uniref:hypothetical protein n=1 Tax=Catenuloplanes sp. NPDC051500 TaxID=3363959 RepID=UPI00378FA815